MIPEVSIPFKREGVSKESCLLRHVEIVAVSIPFKREGVSKVVSTNSNYSERIKFQFPSNGKVYPKANCDVVSHYRVSISFNSLQTGRCIQRERQQVLDQAAVIEFQFPSNGKVYPKLVRGDPHRPFPSFNSLQTGRCIQRNCNDLQSIRRHNRFQFPSNGKVYPKRPQFQPSGAVAPKRQNQTRSAHAYFYVKIYPKNPANPRGH